MDNNEFRTWSRRAADWGVDYRDTLRERPVRPALAPGEVFHAIEVSPPET
ncbi:MAG: aspartate aminotransferase family protein, partial [Mesorhizobium sp.]